MKFYIEKWRRVADEFGDYRDCWDHIGTEEVLFEGIEYDGERGKITIGDHTSGVHLFLHKVFDFVINYHDIEMKAFTLDDKEYWHIRLSRP